jgi:hypothetical protein
MRCPGQLRSSPGDTNSAQRLTQQSLGIRIAELGACEQLGQHGLDIALAEAEVSQARIDLALSIDDPGVDVTPVGGAVGVPEYHGSVDLKLDAELAAVGGTVVRSAQGEEVVRVVSTALRSGHDVMHVDEGRVRATGYTAAVLIARQHRASQGRRDTLFGTRCGLSTVAVS